MIIAPLFQNPSFMEVPIRKISFRSDCMRALPLFPPFEGWWYQGMPPSLTLLFLVIAFRRDVIIQVLIGANAPTPFEAASMSLLFLLDCFDKNKYNKDG